ncbi:MAG: hypothetical protein ACTHZ5_01030 [Micrococcaceae bacterium]
MNAENIITVLVAIIGSGALSTVITLVAARFRHDRQVDQLESWTKELELLDALDQRAGLVATGDSDASRDLAAAVAARTHLNARIARRIVPSAAFEGYFLVIVGVTVGVLGLMLGVYAVVGESDATAAMGNLVLGVLLFLLGLVITLVGANTDGFRTRMRATIEQTLEGRTDPQRRGKLEEKHQWKAGREPSLPWRYEVVVPPQVRQSFKTYLMNLGSGGSAPARAEISEAGAQD